MDESVYGLGWVGLGVVLSMIDQINFLRLRTSLDAEPCLDVRRQKCGVARDYTAGLHCQFDAIWMSIISRESKTITRTWRTKLRIAIGNK
jgi:hypothetical protein